MAFDEESQKAQMISILEKSERENASQMMLLGLCRDVQCGLQRVLSYSELLEDELDMHGGNLDYLQKVTSELEALRRLATQILGNVTANLGEWERLSLAPLLHGVCDRCRLDLNDEVAITEQMESGVLVESNGFEVQELLHDAFCTLMRRGLARGERKEWNVSCRVMNLTAAERRILHFFDDDEAVLSTEEEEQGGSYAVLALLPKDAPFPAIRELRRLRELYLENEEEENDVQDLPTLEAASWVGVAFYNQARLFYVPEYPASSLIVFLKLAPTEDGSDAQFLPQNCCASDNPKTILLVDDVDMIWDVVMGMLQELGYNVILASNGIEAVEIFRANLGAIDLVLLDMLMPEMNGKDTFFRLKAMDPKVRVLASSGYVSEQDIQDVMDAGAAGFLRKPYRLKDLAAAVKKIFAQCDVPRD